MLTIEISIGEFLDKISILYIKSKKIKDKDKLNHVLLELLQYKYLASEHNIVVENDINFDNLIQVNTHIWNLEDKIRKLISENNFSDKFIECAKLIPQLNDKRFAIKNKINTIFKSKFMEQKHYSSSTTYLND